MVLNNRELASLIWLAVAAAWVLSRRDLRSGIAGILKSLANPLLLLPLLGLQGWIALESGPEESWACRTQASSPTPSFGPWARDIAKCCV